MAFVQAFLNGLLVGGVYALIASGMALIFGVMRLVNFAHGAFLMLGTYLSYYGWVEYGLNPYFFFPLWGAVLFLLAVVIYKVLVRRVMGANDFLQILLTEGISLAIVGLAQLKFGADYRQINLPVANRITGFGSLHFSVGYILSFAVSVLLVIALTQFLARTEMGRAIRAVAQNRSVAPLMGIRVERVSAITFGLGIACAGIAGALLLPIFWTNPTVGAPYTLKSFVIVVLGGMGSVQGAALGGLLLGVAEQFTAYTWADRYAEVVNFVIFLLVLLFRPQGLFGGKA
ncbi:MAG TPA: branched-chain amino acid ABC transporter permease [Myxococcaceae bacterium]|nr:branched-chain amino acid ABC transporter permease [Myxococcaceae bacterium]